MSFLFLIVGKNDSPLYETGAYSQKIEEARDAYHFRIHSSLDAVDEALWRKNHMFLPMVDRFSDAFVSAFVTAGGVRFMLLHDFKNEDGIKSFFTEVYELFIKIELNPFYETDSEITSIAFDTRVKASAKKFLKP